VFLDPGARDFYIDWERAASDVVAILRSAAGRDPYDRELSDLVGELSTQSEEFRTRSDPRRGRLGEMHPHPRRAQFLDQNRQPVVASVATSNCWPENWYLRQRTREARLCGPCPRPLLLP